MMGLELNVKSRSATRYSSPTGLQRDAPAAPGRCFIIMPHPVKPRTPEALGLTATAAATAGSVPGCQTAYTGAGQSATSRPTSQLGSRALLRGHWRGEMATTGKRKSDPLPLRAARTRELPARGEAETSQGDPATSASGEELERLIGVIHESFKRKNREHQQRAEQSLQRTIDAAMKDVAGQVKAYQDELYAGVCRR